MSYFNNLSVSKKISLTVFGILGVTLSTYLIIFFLNNDSKVYDRIEEENQQLGLLLTESIRLAMASGADDTTPFVKNLSKFEKIKDVRIIPTELVGKESGKTLDEEEQKVLVSGTGNNFHEKFNDSQVLRSISLLKADESCTDCHDAQNGDVLAVVSIRQSLDKTYSEMFSQKIDAAWIGFIAAVITFLLVSYFVKRNLGKPIEKLSQAAKDFAEGRYENEIERTSNDELGALADSFNDMAEKIDIQIQYLNKLPTPVAVMDTQFNITYINNKGAELLGKPQDMIIGSKCYDNFNTTDCNTANCACKNAMAREDIFSRETIARPNNKDVPIFYSGTPVRDKNGKVIGALEVITDLTDAKERENYLQRNTDRLLKEMDKLANGDLSVSLIPEKHGDAIAKLFDGFNHTVTNMRKMIEQIGETISRTASASVQISASTEQMAAGAQEQSAQSEEVAGAIEQMTRTIFDTAKNVTTAAESSKEAGDLAQEGNTIVSQTIEGMNRIAEVVTAAAKTVEALGKSSDKIGEIVKVINEIADQTNLLALNAAIEAARAGEHGRGFAVVADEVRKLAERTTIATTEISDMIGAIQNDTQGAVKSIYSGKEEVEKGMVLADKAGKSLAEINNSTMNVVDLITQVATASEEQSATSEQISKSIEGISQVTQESSHGVQQISHAAEELNVLIKNLENLMCGFKIETDEVQENYVNSEKLRKSPQIL